MNDETKRATTAVITELKTFLGQWKTLSENKGIDPLIEQALDRLYETNQAELEKLERLPALDDAELNQIRRQAENEALAASKNTPLEQIPGELREEYKTTCKLLNAKGYYLLYNRTQNATPLSIGHNHHILIALPDMKGVRDWFAYYAWQQNI